MINCYDIVAQGIHVGRKIATRKNFYLTQYLASILSSPWGNQLPSFLLVFPTISNIVPLILVFIMDGWRRCSSVKVIPLGFFCRFRTSGIQFCSTSQMLLYPNYFSNPINVVTMDALVNDNGSLHLINIYYSDKICLRNQKLIQCKTIEIRLDL